MGQRIARSIATLILALPCLSAQAQTTVVYRCVDAEGHVSLQDEPCPSGQQQSVRELTEPSGLETVPAIEIDGVAREVAPPPAPPGDEPPPPPPPLWRCVDHEGETYLSRDGVPNARWLPLWVVGIDPRAPAQAFGKVGAPKPKPPSTGPGVPAVAGAREPLIWVEDVCRRLDDAAACEHYADRRADLRRRIFNSQPSERAQLQPEERELTRILRESCGRD